MQGSSPEITGFYSSRPDLISNPNAGSHTPDNWISRSAFRRLDPATQAGQFGNEGRNAIRGPGIGNVDFSLLKSFALRESWKLQFRAECFNLANHANFGLPENDMASPNFGRVLEAGPPRLLQFAIKILFLERIRQNGTDVSSRRGEESAASRYTALSDDARAGPEYPQIWHMFSYKPRRPPPGTIHTGDHARVGPLSPGSVS